LSFRALARNLMINYFEIIINCRCSFKKIIILTKRQLMRIKNLVSFYKQEKIDIFLAKNIYISG